MKFLRSRRHGNRFKWWMLSCTSLGMLLATVDSGTLIIALPDLERSPHTSLRRRVRREELYEAEPVVMRVGDVAERTGLTPRTIRSNEEIGLLPAPSRRRKGEHRSYDDADVERLTELTRLRELLNLSLDELKQLVEAEDARAAIPERLRTTESTSERLGLLDAALPHVELQLEPVRHRIDELRRLEQEARAISPTRPRPFPPLRCDG